MGHTAMYVVKKRVLNFCETYAVHVGSLRRKPRTRLCVFMRRAAKSFLDIFTLRFRMNFLALRYTKAQRTSLLFLSLSIYMLEVVTAAYEAKWGKDGVEVKLS